MNAWGFEAERMASTATVTLIQGTRDEQMQARVLLAKGISPSISAILEADWEGNTRSELPMKLRFGRSSPNGTPGDNY